MLASSPCRNDRLSECRSPQSLVIAVYGWGGTGTVDDPAARGHKRPFAGGSEPRSKSCYGETYGRQSGDSAVERRMLIAMPTCELLAVAGRLGAQPDAGVARVAFSSAASTLAPHLSTSRSSNA